MNVAFAKSLRQGIQLKDPRLYELLGLLIDSAAKNDTDIADLFASVSVVTTAVSATVPDVVTFTYTLLPRYVKLEWIAPGVSVANYEIRKGATWATADYIAKTPTYDLLLEPLTTGNHTYLIKSPALHQDQPSDYST